jgi:hypothetical protein
MGSNLLFSVQITSCKFREASIPPTCDDRTFSHPILCTYVFTLVFRAKHIFSMWLFQFPTGPPFHSSFRNVGGIRNKITFPGNRGISYTLFPNQGIHSFEFFLRLSYIYSSWNYVNVFRILDLCSNDIKQISYSTESLQYPKIEFRRERIYLYFYPRVFFLRWKLY